MLDGKVIIVTGGAGLLGRAFARGIAERGGVAVLTDCDLGRARESATEITGVSGQVVPMRLDITDAKSIDEVLVAVLAAYGRLDGVVNSAYPRNRAYGHRVEDVTYADFCENLGMHVGGYFLVTQRIAAHLAQVGAGSIVNLGSIYGTMPPRFEVYDGTAMTMPVEYAAIKAGIIHLTRYFAQYYKKQGIRVNTLSPGGVRDAQPAAFLDAYGANAGAKGMLGPTDLVGALAFLLSDESRYVTGQNLIVDDGFSL